MDMCILKYIILAFLVFFGTAETWSSTKGSLLRTLFRYYDKLVSPEHKTGNITEIPEITISLEVRSIVSFENNILTIDAYYTERWKDWRLSWNATEFDNVTSLRIPSSTLWLPDIELQNSAKKFELLHNNEVNVILFSSGHIHYSSHVLMRSFCKRNTKSKNDVPCYLKFLSWSREGSVLTVQDGGISLDSDYLNFNWEIVNKTSARNIRTFDCCPYYDVTFDLTLRQII